MYNVNDHATNQISASLPAIIVHRLTRIAIFKSLGGHIVSHLIRLVGWYTIRPVLHNYANKLGVNKPPDS